ncbi:hypothetical protein ACFFX0_10365 [Citricoccus parietis]|uniref:Uncharacterized protein n=1 Tax=Citricoccus parietis TaxID=592307 RepID=A0ABV5FYU2_9MICC
MPSGTIRNRQSKYCVAWVTTSLGAARAANPNREWTGFKPCSAQALTLF